MSFTRHLLLYVLLPVCLGAIIVSYYRFMVADDYLVEYEGACDPYTESCFVGCENEECVDPYYYTKVTKYASDVEAQCGPDFTACEETSVCLPEDRSCEITFCDPETAGDTEICEEIEGAEETPAEEELPAEELPEEATPV